MSGERAPAQLTERQRLAAEAAGDVAIVAGAGTGKTHTLGHRYLAHLAEGRSPLEIVAVTFTERAAHELRARVRRYAAQRFGAEDSRLAELEAATIGTVHALCLRICRDHPEAAGVPPDVRILDPLEGSIWTEERLAAAMERLPAGLFRVMPYERVRDALRELLKGPWKAERALRHGPERWQELVEQARQRAFDAHLRTPEAVAARTRLASLSGPAADAGERTRTAVLDAFAASESGDDATVRELLYMLRANVGTARAWGGDQQALREALGVALNSLRAWLGDPLAPLELGPADEVLKGVLDELRSGFAQASDELATAKRRAGVVDFADVELAALRALDDGDVREHYRDRWTALLVDEVQDTSPVQEEILVQIAGFCRTTLVGDAKQSIYGFRGAEAQVFRRMTGRIVSGGGANVVLDRSFRTHRQLVGRVNEVFARVLGEDHEPLEADAEPPEPAPHLLRWSLTLPRRTPASVARLAEAHRIADEISRRLDAGVRVRDPKVDGGVRPLRPADIAVLARTWAPLDLLAEVLPARGVPAVHTGGGDLMLTREAQDGMAALRFLADPHDDVALVALLRGPAFGVSDAELEHYHETAARHAEESSDFDPARGSWWQRLASDPPAFAGRAVQVLAALQQAAARTRPSRLLQELDRATGWSAVVGNLPGGPRRSADLDGFLELVRTFEREDGDVFSVVRRLRRIVEAEIEVDRPALDAHDAVTLTTIHRAKGLEWPWVIVAAIDAGSRKPYQPVRFSSDLGVAVRVEAGDDRNATPALWTLLSQAEEAAEEAERRRLLYVALTRASDLVAVSVARSSGPIFDLLEPGLEAAGVPNETQQVERNAVSWPEPPLPGPPTHEAEVEEPLSGGMDERWSDTPAQAHEDAAWETSIWRAEALAPEVAAILTQLRESGAPAPVAEGADAAEAAAPLAPWTLARWDVAGKVVRLVEAYAPTTDGTDPSRDELIVRADPLAPDATLDRLRSSFEVTADGSAN